MGQFVVKYLDADGDLIQTGFEVDDMTALNFADQVTDQNALLTALNDVTIGANKGYSRVAAVQENAVAPPANMGAQTNIQWIMDFTDNTTGLHYTYRIGTAKLDEATIFYNGAPALDLTAGVGLALKTAFEAVALHEGNPVTLQAVFYRE